MTMRGAKSLLGVAPNQKLPITPEILCQIRRQIDFRNPVAVQLWAAILLGWWAFLRKANLTSPTRTFDPTRSLCRGDFSVINGGIVCDVRFSKTIQAKERVFRVAIPRLSQGHQLCPVVAVGCALAASPLSSPRAPAFLEAFNPPTPLTRSFFDRKLAALLQGCGLDSSKYSGHSLRRGGATFALAAGVPGELIQAQGDWKSDAYKRYLDLSVPQRLIAVNKMSQHLYRVL
ncbi:MAG: hypothetical protein GY696_38900 [Gammaproteobacteria bacterium]|nr:hypothetical protein [Gammaproteobacteria bacterium]